MNCNYPRLHSKINNNDWKILVTTYSTSNYKYLVIGKEMEPENHREILIALHLNLNSDLIEEILNELEHP